MRLSVVATLYCSESYIDEFCERAARAATQLAGDEYEIILVNDGSPDMSREVALAARENNPRIVLVDLSRNFGHDKAMLTGLAHARGDLIFLLDSDLEEEPEWLLPFDETRRREACDVVYGVQRRRKGKFLERWTGLLFYRAHRAVTGMSFPENVVTARLMTRRYVQSLLSHDEREVYMAGLCHITGFEQRPHLVQKHSSSATTYTLRRKLAMVVDSITSFSNAPLIGIFYIGILISFVAIIYIAYLSYHRLVLEQPPEGWTSVMASIWLMGGLVICFIGIVGIYLSKIFAESKRRPLTIVRHVYGRDEG